jgi:hypothetical protein
MSEATMPKVPFSVETARALFSYDSETGSVVYLPRSGNPPKDKAVNSRYAGKTAGNLDGKGYLRLQALGKDVKAHRLAYALHYGEWPRGQIDHINGVRSDNRIENLRVVTVGENNLNKAKQRNNTSGHVGVYFDTARGAWRSRIKVKGICYDLGCYTNVEDAAQARKLAERRLGFHENHGRPAP